MFVLQTDTDQGSRIRRRGPSPGGAACEGKLPRSHADSALPEVSPEQMAPKRSDPKGRKQEYLRFLVSGRARGRKIELERNGAVGYVVNTRGMRKKGGYKGNPEEKRAYKGKSPPPPM